MIERRLDNWEEFEKVLAKFFQMGPLARDRYIFRGHADAQWNLTTTLDRYVRSINSTNREEVRKRLLSEFASQAASLAPSDVSRPLAMNLLARHHGLPSAIMDWSRSPYVAAYFAYSDEQAHAADLAVWCLDLGIAIEPLGDNVEVIDDPVAVRLNPRAIEQRSVFLNVHHPVKMEDQLPTNALQKFVLPANERRSVLARLDGMGLNHRTLFRDLDAAARVAAWRVRDMLRE